MACVRGLDDLDWADIRIRGTVSRSRTADADATRTGFRGR
jgi:hypothetical protein